MIGSAADVENLRQSRRARRSIELGIGSGQHVRIARATEKSAQQRLSFRRTVRPFRRNPRSGGDAQAFGARARRSRCLAGRGQPQTRGNAKTTVAVERYRIDAHASDSSSVDRPQQIGGGKRRNREDDGARANRRPGPRCGSLKPSRSSMRVTFEPNRTELLWNGLHQPVDQLGESIGKRPEDAVRVERSLLPSERSDDAAGAVLRRRSIAEIARASTAARRRRHGCPRATAPQYT